MPEPIRLSLMQEDMLKEIGNFGAAKATDLLASFAGFRIVLSIPYVKLSPIERIPAEIEDLRSVVTVSFVRLFGDFPGGVFSLVSKRTALVLVDLFKKKPIGATQKLEFDEIEVLLEMTNILNNAYITALANFLNAKIIPGPPKTVLDVSFLIDELIEQKKEQQYALTIVTQFDIGIESEATGKFILLLDEPTLKRLLEALDAKQKSPEEMVF